MGAEYLNFKCSINLIEIFLRKSNKHIFLVLKAEAAPALKTKKSEFIQFVFI